MAKTKEQKKEILDRYKRLLTENESVVFFSHNKVDANTLVEIKKELHKENVYVTVLKKSLLKKAFSDLKFDVSLSGQILGIIFNNNTPYCLKKSLAIIKSIKNKNKEIVLDVSFGVFQGRYITFEEVISLSEVPEKNVSVSMIIGILDQGIVGTLNVLQNPVVSYLNIIGKAYKTD